MCVFNELGKVLKVESRRLDYMPVVVRVADEACKGTLQEIHEPRRPLDIGEGCRIGRLQEIKHLSADDPEVKIAKQLLIMLTANAEEIHDLSVEVIQHLDLGRLLVKEHLSASRERFDIRRVFRKERNHPLGQCPFSANVREWSNHVFVGLESLLLVNGTSTRLLYIEASGHHHRPGTERQKVAQIAHGAISVSYTHIRAHETVLDIV